MEDICKATITLGEARITFEGPASFVEAQVQRYAEVQPSGSLLIGNSGPIQTSGRTKSEKELFIEKRPRGHHEIATVFAFALTEGGAEEFSEEDIRRAYLRAEVRPPKYVSQALRDAKSKYDYITTGSKRGLYKLTNHGDRTVRFDMPRSAG